MKWCETIHKKGWSFVHYAFDESDSYKNTILHEIEEHISLIDLSSKQSALNTKLLNKYESVITSLDSEKYESLVSKNRKISDLDKELI